MTISEKDYLPISEKLLDRAEKDGIERKVVKLVIRKNGAVLVLRRAKGEHFPDLYELPGGGLNENEDIFAGARRELYEETGLSVKEFISQPESIDFNTISDQKKCRGYVFVVLPRENDIVLNPDEHSGHKWVSLAEVDNLAMFPGTKTIINKVLKDLVINLNLK